MNDSLTIAIVLGIIVTVNVMSYNTSFRFDLTDNKDYSISDVTKKVSGDLKDVITIKTYFSRNLPAKYLNLEQEINDMLDGYVNYSKGRIKVDSIDPAKLENAAEELGKKGLPTLQFNVMRNDSFQVVNGYLGLIVEYGSKNQVIPIIDSTKTLEYELTLAIKKLTAQGLPTLAIVTSNGAMDPERMSQAHARLSQIYQVKSVDLTAKDPIGDDVSALLVIGVSQKMDDAVLKKIDAFVMKGKPVIFMVDGVLVSPQTGASKNQIGLSKLLSAYGADVKNDLIADESNGRASFSAPGSSYYLTYQINYPLWPKVLAENFDRDSAIVSGLSSIIMPWASSLEVSSADGRSVSVLAKTTDKAMAQVDSYNLEPEGAFAGGQEVKQYDLAALVTGKLVSPFGQGETADGKVIVVGDSDFASDMFSGPVSDNLVFFQNIIDGLVFDSDLIDIRSKGTVERPIKPISNTAKEVLRYSNIFGISVLVLIFGFFRYFLRRRGRKAKIAGSVEVKVGPKAWLSSALLPFKALFAAAKAVAAKVRAKKAPEAPAVETDKEAYKDIKN
jgi:gliding-associated putative ABC transporter substrate-binding component GldG